MFHIVLFEPEIPPNTGNIIRLAANTGCQLHLIQPLGFELEDKLLRRAGLDYHEWARVSQHPSLEHFKNNINYNSLYAFSTKGKRLYCDVAYQQNDALLFGPETRGLGDQLLQSMPPDSVLTMPMQQHSRSLNLSNTVSIAVYEAWRQLDFTI
ncbi:MAG: tRNA (cytidine(34)-2'-O)-methyltransferase [Gammaproteobacteria bacterium]|nr:tRNA (cytidine(34)-2'-O)-methyltransferase [Gammaproteobacteria bacterium]